MVGRINGSGQGRVMVTFKFTMRFFDPKFPFGDEWLNELVERVNITAAMTPSKVIIKLQSVSVIPYISVDSLLVQIVAESIYVINVSLNYQTGSTG